MKKKTAFCLCLGALLLAGAIWQIHRIEAYGSRFFLDHTYVNGVDCSAMTVGEAAEALQKTWNEKTFLITENGKTIGEICDLDLEYTVKDQLRKKKQLPLYRLLWRYITGEEQRITVKMEVEKPTESLSAQIDEMKFLKRRYKIRTRDAYVDLSDREFRIVKEVQGDNVNQMRFEKAVLRCIEKGQFSLDYKESDYYAVPGVRAEDKELLEYRQYCQKWLSQKITYQFYDGNYTLTPKQINSMMTVEKETRTVSTKAVRRFVRKLADDHNTVGTSRTFRSAEKGNIRVSGGNFGYIIDEKAEVKKLTKNLKNGKDVRRQPEYSQRPYRSGNGNGDIGTSYVEIDLSRQKLWLFQNGRRITSCSVVTGNVADGFATPSGVYYLSYKSRDAVLRGSNKDGSKYETPVKYWMPFNRGIGMHDASWRSAFGGEIYRKGGSHGCINMPPASAELVYSYISPGYPVVVHY